MEVAGCISLLLQLFLHLVYTYTDLPHLLSLNHFFSCFLQLVPSISSSVGPVNVFHLLHVPLPSSKHLPQVAQNMTIPPHTIRHCQLICCFLQSQHVDQLLCIFLLSTNFTLHRPITLTIDLSAILKIATSTRFAFIYHS